MPSSFSLGLSVHTAVNYSTIKAAQPEIDELLSDIQLEIDKGERQAGEGYDAEEYKIYDNVEKEYVV